MFKLTEDTIEEALRQNLDVKEVSAYDLKGGNHWQVDVTASDFNGLNRIKQHQLVYKALAEHLANESIHALVINSKGTE